MQKLVLSDFYVAIDNVLHKGKHLSFAHFSFFLEERAEIALLAVFGDDEAVGRFPNDIEAFEDVGVLEFGQGLDFAI
jgi:hypothetical protein